MPHDDLVAAFLKDSLGKALVDHAYTLKPDQSRKQWAANMIAWFSQRITVDDESEYGKRFERRKIGDSWAYRPRQSARPSPGQTGNMVLLQLMLKREYFLAILDCTKKKEFRDKTDFWERQLMRKPYTHVRFRNGYAKVAPEMTVELKRITKTDSCYELHLGKIVDKRNISLLEEL